MNCVAHKASLMVGGGGVLLYCALNGNDIVNIQQHGGNGDKQITYQILRPNESIYIYIYIYAQREREREIDVYITR